MDSSLWTELNSVTFLVCAVLLVGIVYLYSTCQRYFKIRSLKNLHDCEEPAKYPHSDRIWGSDLTRLRAAAMKEGRFFPLYLSQFSRHGKTFEENFQGQRLINTAEPANVQQITALAFEDFGKDPEKLRVQEPFLGPSVFSDGRVWREGRALVRPTFARAEIADVEQLAAFTERFMELVTGDGRTVDMQPLLHRLVSAIFQAI